MKTSETDAKVQAFSQEFSHFPLLKKRRFLEGYAQTGSILQASRHAGISRRTHLNWRKTDRRFAAACEDALVMFIEELELEARRRAVEGTLEPVYYSGKVVGGIRRYSDNLLMFLLKAARPEKYRDFYSGYQPESRTDPEELRRELHRKLDRLAASINGTGSHPPA